MRCWLFFHRDLDSAHPEVHEALRFDKVADNLGIDLSVLKPREFDLVVDSNSDWSATYNGRALLKPDAIICRTGAETSSSSGSSSSSGGPRGATAMCSAGAREAPIA